MSLDWKSGQKNKTIVVLAWKRLDLGKGGDRYVGEIRSYRGINKGGRMVRDKHSKERGGRWRT